MQYVDQFQNYLGLAPSDNNIRLGEDGKPFTTILYGNGPGYKLSETAVCSHERENLTEVDTSKFTKNF